MTHQPGPLRTARRSLMASASASTLTTWHRSSTRFFSVKNAPVDNFYSASILPTAEKIGIVDKVCKCLNPLSIPLNVLKVIHYAQ